MLTAPVTSSAIGLSSCKCHESTTPVCGFTQDKLITLLKEANYDKSSPAYAPFFESLTCTTNAKMMDHCKECTKTIAMHGTGASGLPPSAGGLEDSHISLECTFGGVTFSLLVDTGCTFPLMLDEDVFSRVATITPAIRCNEQFRVANGAVISITQKVVAKLSIQLRDGSTCEHTVEGFRANRNIIGIIGLELMGLSVDTPAKTVVKFTHFCGYYWKYRDGDRTTGVPMTIQAHTLPETPPCKKFDRAGSSSRCKCGHFKPDHAGGK